MELSEQQRDFLTAFLDDIDFATDEKGRRLHGKKGKKIEVKNFDAYNASIIMPSETGKVTYELDFIFDYEEDMVFTECECPAFESYGECKHAVAAAIYLLNDYQKLLPVKAVEASPVKDTVPALIKVDYKSLSANDVNYWAKKHYGWDTYRTERNSSLLKAVGTQVFFKYKEAPKKDYEQVVTFQPPSQLTMTCTCGNAIEGNICLHLVTALAVLRGRHGSFYFHQFKDFTNEKNKLLAPYGLSMKDVEAKDFEFEFSFYGDVQLTAAPAYLVKVTDETTLAMLGRQLVKAKSTEGIERPPLPPGEFIDFELGYLFNFAVKQGIHFSLQPLTITNKNGKTGFEKITLSKKENLAYLKSLDDEQYQLFEKLTDEQLHRHLISHGFPQLGNYSAWQAQLNKNSLEEIRQYYHGTLKALWPFLLEQNNLYLIGREKTFSQKNLEPIRLGATHPTISFAVIREEKFITIKMFFNVDGEALTIVATPGISYLFVISHGKYYLPENFEHVKLMQQFACGFLKFPVSHQFDVLRKLVLPLQQLYAVEIDRQLQFQTITAEAMPQVFVSEYMNQYLMLQPQFVYDGHTASYDDEPDLTIQQDDGMFLIERDKNTEKKFYERLRILHPSFGKQLQNHFYYLPFADVMKGNWFLHAIRQLQEENITVKGIQDLKKFRYNTAKPVWEMKTSSGTDWFDLKVTVSFGDQEVPIRDIQKAIRTGQKIVVLGDGTFGMLPEEWLQQYGMLMKMGAEKDGQLRVNKMHFTVIDELHSMIDEEAILLELAEKKLKLQTIENIKPHPVSKQIKATLRPYQQSGFNWMQVLDELSWGGCLADDMGLGKTLQAICFLQYIKEKNVQATSLVVCPTSLIYNWESELQKFAPTLKYHIYYGGNRSFSDEHLENYDIIITSYGTMRNDIKELQQHQFYYIILDESQHIKNPDALVTKAAQILKANNRIILSGTPIQNNTFDLYAQMHFLNPGFLGNKEFFKTEFATPIDKGGDSGVAAQLRKLIYPFMLRRTKEQVAKDLPDKTESILWCEMDKQQRAVYDDYKNYYRHQLLNKIEEQGMQKAAIYILEGLLRLRQICDSPLLVKDEEVTTTKSVKLEELLREVQENTGNHKLLIFSQFTEMLALVKEAFVQNKITHLYLDGSTPARKRKDLVAQFQTDTNIKAFLISLKAGGVGLNLTAADYVYLIDPWWNPAVEDQAIDRTHRIGQTQKVFAYKMICKDTVEEKILLLQQKKKSLSKELISEETGFIKHLTKDDVAFLFS